MIDLGAGDGQVTRKLATFYHQTFATETSKPMQNLLKSKNITVLPVETWSQQHGFDLISCLNLLDRCDNPQQVLEDVKKSLRPKNGLFLVALVLPFKPFVEARNSKEPAENLDIKGETFIEQAESFVEMMQSQGFQLLSWTRVPYLCQGDLLHSVYYLDDAVFLFNLQ